MAYYVATLPVSALSAGYSPTLPLLLSIELKLPASGNGPSLGRMQLACRHPFNSDSGNLATPRQLEVKFTPFRGGGLLHAGGLQSPDEQFEVAVSSATSPVNEAAVDGHRPVRARARGCLNPPSF